MKLKNIYSMCMGLSVFLWLLPLIALIVAHIFSYIGDCGWGTNMDITQCYDAWLIETLSLLSIYWVITLPLGIVFLGIFYFMYITARRS